MEEFQNQIEAYIRDEMTLQEKQEFEKILAQNPKLQEEFLIHQQLYNHINDDDSIETDNWENTLDKEELASYLDSDDAKKLRSTIAKVRNNQKENQSTKSNNKSIPFIIMAIAASFALLLIFNVFITDDSSSGLYSEYSDLSSLPSLTYRQGASDLSKAQALFEDKKYKESYDLLIQQYADKGNVDSPILIYLGVISLEINQFDEANKYFDQLISSDAVDASKGYWYKVLVFLKQEKIFEAKEVLEIIINNKDYYNYDLALELNDRL